MLQPLVPMEPTFSSSIPHTHSQKWSAQLKWDGVRLLVHWNGIETRLYNRRQRDRTLHYPELIPASAYCKAQSIILDGEIVALGADGKPSFHEVMRRDGIRQMHKVVYARQQTPISYMAFDILYLNGEWITNKTFLERQSILQGQLLPHNIVQLVPTFTEGDALFQVAQEHGLEGIVLKNKQSPYSIGEKNEHWLKIKHSHDLFAIIGGYTIKNGRINALIVGLYDESHALHGIGHVGSGKLGQHEWIPLTEQLVFLQQSSSPFDFTPERAFYDMQTCWVQPVLTVRIQYMAWTPAHSMRQPVLQSIVSIPPEQCTWMAIPNRPFK